MVLPSQTVSDMTVIIRLQRDLSLLNNFLLNGQFSENIVLNLRRNYPGRGGSLVFLNFK